MPCVFCNASPTTVEHILPRCLRCALPGEGRLVHEWRAPEEESPSKRWTADVVSFTARVVCARCNNGWMSRLEVAAKPYLSSMIRGVGRELYEGGKEAVARWALKTAMMLDYGQEAKFRSIPSEDYTALFQTMGLLPDTYIWLAACDFGGRPV